MTDTAVMGECPDAFPIPGVDLEWRIGEFKRADELPAVRQDHLVQIGVGVYECDTVFRYARAMPGKKGHVIRVRIVRDVGIIFGVAEEFEFCTDLSG